MPNELRKQRPARTPEQREKQLVALAVDLVEQRLIDGTASSAEIVHLLKLSSPVVRLERQKLEMENALIQAKIDTLNAERQNAEAYQEAIEAMRSYQPSQVDYIDGDFTEME